MARKAADDKNTKTGINATLANLQKQFGEGAVIRMGDAPRTKIEVIPTGVIGLDIALGRGGVPRGRIIEVYGPESSGKTSFALSVVAQAQKQGLIAAFVDAEHALDPEYAEKLGVDIDSLILSQPDDGEQALEIADQLVKSGDVGILIVDSVAALTPRSEIEGEMGDANVGKQARMMSQAMRKMTAHIQKTGTTVIFINQLREKIGLMFGNPETTTGGKALKFYASIRIDIRSTPNVKDGDEIIGSTVKVKVVKNKVAPPFKTAELRTYWGEGFSKAQSLIDTGVKLGFIENPKGWYKYGGQSYREAALIDLLKQNPDEADKLYQELLEASLPKDEPKQEEDFIVDEETGAVIDPKTGEVLDAEPTESEADDDSDEDDGSIFDG